MNVQPDLFADIVFILVAAFAGGFLARALHLPSLLGYLIAGVAMGPHSLGLVGNVAEVQAVAEWGGSAHSVSAGPTAGLLRPSAALRDSASCHSQVPGRTEGWKQAKANHRSRWSGSSHGLGALAVANRTARWATAQAQRREPTPPIGHPRKRHCREPVAGHPLTPEEELGNLETISKVPSPVVGEDPGPEGHGAARLCHPSLFPSDRVCHAGG